MNERNINEKNSNRNKSLIGFYIIAAASVMIFVVCINKLPSLNNISDNTNIKYLYVAQQFSIYPNFNENYSLEKPKFVFAEVLNLNDSLINFTNTLPVYFNICQKLYNFRNDDNIKDKIYTTFHEFDVVLLIATRNFIINFVDELNCNICANMYKKVQNDNFIIEMKFIQNMNDSIKFLSSEIHYQVLNIKQKK